MSFTEDFIVRAEDATYEIQKPVLVSVGAGSVSPIAWTSPDGAFPLVTVHVEGAGGAYAVSGGSSCPTKQAIRQNAERLVMQAEIVRLRAALDALEPARTPEPKPAIFSAIRRSNPPVSLVQYGRMGVKLIP